MKGPLRLLGSGIALPGPAIGTEDLLERVEACSHTGMTGRGRSAARLMGIEHRHFCRDFYNTVETPREGDSNPELSARAVRQALEESALAPGRLSYLLGHTTTPHTLLPPNIAWVADRLDYDGPFAELRQACTGFANALQMAAGLLSISPGGPVAIVGSETGSVYCDASTIDRHQIVNLVQMGDGAGAVLLGPPDGTAAASVSHLFFGSAGLGRAPGFFLEAGGSADPASAPARVGFQNRFEDVKRSGPALFHQGAAALRDAGVDLKTVDWVLPHQVNARMGEYLAPKLEVPVERFVVDADSVGNLGSASIWVALHRLRRSGRLRPGDTVAVLGAEATKYLYGGFLYTHGE